MRLEMDATNMKQIRTKESYDLSPLGVIFKEIKALWNVAFDDVKISVCPRLCNPAAHELAMQGALLGDGYLSPYLTYVLAICPVQQFYGMR